MSVNLQMKGGVKMMKPTCESRKSHKEKTNRRAGPFLGQSIHKFRPVNAIKRQTNLRLPALLTVGRRIFVGECFFSFFKINFTFYYEAI